MCIRGTSNLRTSRVQLAMCNIDSKTSGSDCEDCGRKLRIIIGRRAAELRTARDGRSTDNIRRPPVPGCISTTAAGQYMLTTADRCGCSRRRCANVDNLLAIVDAVLFAFPTIARARRRTDEACWPNFHRAMMSATLGVLVLSSICQRVLIADAVTRLLLSADAGNDECSLRTNSNYTGLCHCSSLLDIHCTGLDQIPRFVSNDRIFAAINMAEQVLTEVPQSAVDGLKVRSSHTIRSSSRT